MTPGAREIEASAAAVGLAKILASSKLDRFARDYASSRLRLLVGAAARRPTTTHTHQWTSAGPAAESLSVGAPKFRPLFYFLLLSALSRRAVQPRCPCPCCGPPVTGNARDRHVRHLFVPVRYFSEIISLPLRERSRSGGCFEKAWAWRERASERGRVVCAAPHARPWHDCHVYTAQLRRT